MVRTYESRVPSSTHLPFRRAFNGIVPFRRFRWVRICMTGRDKRSQLSSDTYDIYFANPNLNPEVRTDPADENFSTPWMLGEERGDATVEDICDFIVEYINSDVMVCPRRPASHARSLRSHFLRFIGTPGGPAHRHCRSIKGGNLFAYSLSRSYPPVGRCVRRTVHETRQAL